MGSRPAGSPMPGEQDGDKKCHTTPEPVSERIAGHGADPFVTQHELSLTGGAPTALLLTLCNLAKARRTA